MRRGSARILDGATRRLARIPSLPKREWRAARNPGLETGLPGALVRVILPIKEPATALGISVRTAETHRTNIMRKLNAHSAADLVRYAVRNHIIQP